MNRRHFITSGTLCAGALSLVPNTAFSSTSAISIYSVGQGFNALSNQIRPISLGALSNILQAAHKELSRILDIKGYNYDGSEVVKFSNNCFAVPLSKDPLLGFKSKTLALLIEHNGDYKHYILNEKTTKVFSSLVENYTLNSSTNGLNLDAVDFITPIEVIKESIGRTHLFVYKNKSGNTITLRSSNKHQVILVN
ncbi:hypothetical protein N7U66_03665 [Lacinutrix neustonica]|uniref:Uncharacterized protein n=1 Tax=Lacinutrix neustonica TaxID=2980107 RepID=A0A9E8MYC3_9FLAO|nr:hypothetical protein [Lacinutrix neustonica]WAC02772.1 hypothetical protein N7U66_03665 [Lacinutrix neustonica]